METDTAPLVHNLQLEMVKKKLNYILHNPIARVIIACLIVADIIIVIVQLSTSETIFPLEIISLILSCIFMVEVGIRIFAKGVKNYFTRFFCVFEFFVVFSTFCLSIATVAIYSTTYQDYGSTIEYVRLVTAILRVFRIFKMLRLFRFFTEWVNLLRASRYTTSQNKRRYVTDEFDLDLCYITDQIIAMSFPSSGLIALYRNPIGKVAAFFNKKHPGKYLVINMCSERGYDPAHFNGNVRRFMVDDHYPPNFNELVRIVDIMNDWLVQSEEHVVAVHCRGGKGRTGTAICALLLKMGGFESTHATLDFFADQRTDMEIGTKYQGVETPSQARYLKYYERYLSNGCIKPPKKDIQIEQFNISNLLKLQRDALADLCFRIYLGREEIYYGNLFFKIGCSTLVNEVKDVVEIKLDRPPIVSEDVKIVFTSKRLPTHYWKSAFYYLFHTSFLLDNGNSLLLSRSELDNPHKLQKFYGDDFSVEMIYSEIL